MSSNVFLYEFDPECFSVAPSSNKLIIPKMSTNILSPTFLLALSTNITSSKSVLFWKSNPAIHVSFNALNVSQSSVLVCSVKPASKLALLALSSLFIKTLGKPFLTTGNIVFKTVPI